MHTLWFLSLTYEYSGPCIYPITWALVRNRNEDSIRGISGDAEGLEFVFYMWEPGFDSCYPMVLCALSVVAHSIVYYVPTSSHKRLTQKVKIAIALAVCFNKSLAPGFILVLTQF